MLIFACGVLDPEGVVFSLFKLIFTIFLLLTAGLLGLCFLWWRWAAFIFFKKNRRDSSPFECGFEHSKFSRASFSLRFFLILILFLIFDVEISFFVQTPFFLKTPFSVGNRVLYFFSFGVVTIGLFEEWREGVLNWR